MVSLESLRSNLARSHTLTPVSRVIGNVELLGAQDAEDGHDVVELLAKLPYCNGNIGMAGNSALAISQYFIAATQPPSLKAIAPWEGLGDMYREQFNRGGVYVWVNRRHPLSETNFPVPCGLIRYNISNFNLIAKLIIQGSGGVEDFEIMCKPQLIIALSIRSRTNTLFR
jgi:hypothetical protein